MRSKMILTFLLTGSLLLSACSNTPSQSLDNSSSSSSLSDNAQFASLFSDRDMEIGYDTSSAAQISLTGSGASCDSDAVTIDGSTVTITDEGTYILSGQLDNGMVIVNAEETDKVQLVLDNVEIANATSAAIYIPSADKVFSTMADGSDNTLKNGGTYTAIDDNNIDSVIFSKSDLTLNGTGSLTIEATAGHGVVSKDDLVVTSGTYTITAASHGLCGKDSVAIADGVFVLNTGKDGVQSDNTEDSEKGYVYLAGGDYTITAQGDGFSASSWMQVDGGSYTITTGGGSANGETHTDTMMPGGMGKGQWNRDSATGERPQPPEGTEFPGNNAAPDGTQPMERPEGENFSADTQSENSSEESQTADDTPSTKGFKAGTTLTIGDGSFTMDCADDGFHSNGDLVYLNGTAQISTGDDALHADGALTVENGTIDIVTCYEGLEGTTVTILDGNIQMVASDDGINAAGDAVSGSQSMYISIEGGTITIDAGGDGLDSNGDLIMSGGTVFVSGSQQGADSPLDYDGSATITGGTLIGTGMSAMMQNFGDASTQGSILLTVNNQEAGSTISVSDSSGNTIASWTAPKSYNSVIISSPQLTAGNTYTITTGSDTTQITLDSLIYGNSNGRPGGGMGGRGQHTPAQ